DNPLFDPPHGPSGKTVRVHLSDQPRQGCIAGKSEAGQGAVWEKHGPDPVRGQWQFSKGQSSGAIVQRLRQSCGRAAGQGRRPAESRGGGEETQKGKKFGGEETAAGTDLH